jgi:hypothetical protein
VSLFADLFRHLLWDRRGIANYWRMIAIELTKGTSRDQIANIIDDNKWGCLFICLLLYRPAKGLIRYWHD